VTATGAISTSATVTATGHIYGDQGNFNSGIRLAGSFNRLYNLWGGYADQYVYEQIFLQTPYFYDTGQMNTDPDYGFSIGILHNKNSLDQGFLTFAICHGPGRILTKGFISGDAATNYRMNDFTGQHRTYVENIPYKIANNYEGLIVSACLNEYMTISGNIVKGIDAITINESLPLCALSKIAYDKKCFGVISSSEDSGDTDARHERDGGVFVSVVGKERGDTRVWINSVGEGAIWVVNTNGNLESGDYITTSEVSGYGQKQDSEFLANYTVAKITMDCDFNPPHKPVQIILKDDEGNNILNDDNQIQFVDHPSGATSPAYKVKDLGNGVLAAFVGCTYHCG
jgi:hypothetical protein